MPTPRAGETRDEFIGRCIPEIVGEGKPQDVAVATCFSLWENRNKIADEEKRAFEAVVRGEKQIALPASGRCPASYPTRRGNQCFR